jgi:hypothetical protein
MKTSSTYDKHIFCIEGEWQPDLRRKDSIENALKFLENGSVKKIGHIHRHCSTVEEFNSRLSEYFKRRYQKYNIFYICFHGLPNSIKINHKIHLGLDEIADFCEGKLKDKMVHFGSCETMNIDKSQITAFLEKTGALCVSGFKKEVPFIPATMLDMLFFEMSQYYKQLPALENAMKRNYRTLMKELDFVMHYG